MEGSQDRLHKTIRARLERLDTPSGEVRHSTSAFTDRGHRRQALPQVTTLEAVHGLPEGFLFEWSHLKTLVRVRSETGRKGKVVSETWFYVSTLPMNTVDAITEGVPSHWRVGNSLQWVLDVAFNRRAESYGKDAAPEYDALRNHIMRNLLRQELDIMSRRIKAALCQDYHHAVLTGFPGRTDDWIIRSP